MNIVLITTGQPSVNPRVVKEADALQAAGMKVTVLFCFWIRWAEEADERLLKNAKWSYRLIGGSPTKNKLLYFFTRTRFKINGELNRKFSNKFLFAERAQARCYDELLQAAKKIKAAWYIGHNLGALSIAVRAARYHAASAGFDFEDFHREENAEMDGYEKSRISYLETKYVQQLKYLSSSSPLITKKIEQNFASFNGPVLTLLNCFPLSQQPKFKDKSADDNTLQLFWFSQTVGSNRGIEELIEALKHLNDSSIHLTIVGRVNNDMQVFLKENTVRIKDNIHLAGIIQPEELPAFASRFDVGLALETGFSTNNNIALSNKIFTYLLAGNAVILSETEMQKSFNRAYKIGEGFKIGDIKALTVKILEYKDRDKLNTQRLYNYQLSQNIFNWENESRKLLGVIR